MTKGWDFYSSYRFGFATLRFVSAGPAGSLGWKGSDKRYCGKGSSFFLASNSGAMPGGPGTTVEDFLGSWVLSAKQHLGKVLLPSAAGSRWGQCPVRNISRGEASKS